MTLQGLSPPIPTPFLEDRVDHRALANNVRQWMQTSLAGVVVLGSNGEAPLLEEDEADAATATVREHVPPARWLIAGTGRESTAATIGACRRAARHGVDAVLVRTPSFYKNVMTSEALVRHYTAVADASPAPVLLYNVAMYTGVDLQPDAVARLAEHPNIAGMKESGSNIAQVARLVADTPPDFPVLSGSATTFFAALCVGASGGVLALSAVLPEACVRLRELVAAGRYEDARVLQQRLVPLARLLSATYGVAGLKFALDQVGYAGGPPRPPLAPLTPEAEHEIVYALAAFEGAAAASDERRVPSHEP